MSQKGEIPIETGAEAAQIPRRLAMIPKPVPVRFSVEREAEPLVMSFPHLVIRIMIGFMGTVVVISILALAFDAPLEEIADPEHTPNPAKAPWYFLGLQELLHYFPPVVAGILIPALVIIALVVIPYFQVNVERTGLWSRNVKGRLLWLTAAAAAFVGASAWFHAWDVAVPTALVYAMAVLPLAAGWREGWRGWIARRALSEWIMTWFVVLATVLTLVGTFFRGPGWSWVWPGSWGR